MIVPLAVAYQYHSQYILGPALVIILAVMIGMLVKYPSLKNKIGGLLVLIGLVELLATLGIAFLWGLLIGFATLMAGILMVSKGASKTGEHLYSGIEKRPNQQRMRTLRKSIFVILAIIIVSSALLITVRSTTNLIHEQFQETYYGGSSPNLTLRGVITGLSLNHEVNNGYSYHIFPAVISLNVTEFVGGTEFWQNQTSGSKYWQQKSVALFYEKSDVPNLKVGQLIEANGYWVPWIEDSLYSGAFVVTSQIDGSYVKLAEPIGALTSNANLVNTGYLKLPSLPTQDNGNSSLFLVSATSSYGVYSEQNCFIINATIRNDYSTQQLPPPDSYGGSRTGNAYFIIMAKLYSQSEQIIATEITAPHAVPVDGSPQHFLEAGNTGSFELYLATSAKNIESYTIELVAVGGIPIP